MASNYPDNFNNFSNPQAKDTLAEVPHSTQHAQANDAIEAIEATLGLNPESDFSTVDERIWDNKGDWTASTAYALNDAVRYRGYVYLATTAHTSGTTFDTTMWGRVTGQTNPPPNVGSLRIVGHSYLDTGAITEGGGAKLKTPGRLMEAFGVHAGRTSLIAKLGSNARWVNYLVNEVDPGHPIWPPRPPQGVACVWWGGNDVSQGEGGWQQHSYTQAMRYVTATLRQGQRYENDWTNVTLTGTWATTVSTGASGGDYAASSTPGDKVTIQTDNRMGRKVSGVWVDLAFLGSDDGMEAEVWLDGVKHGDIDVGMGTGTAFNHGQTYNTWCVYRMWIPTTYQGSSELATTTHVIEIRLGAQVDGGSFRFDYWAVEAPNAGPVLLANQPMPANPTPLAGEDNATVIPALNGWLQDVVDEFDDPMVRIVDMWTIFESDGWTAWSNKIYYMDDGLHPSDHGSRIAAAAFYDEFVAALDDGGSRADFLTWMPEMKEELFEPPQIFQGVGRPTKLIDDFERPRNYEEIGDSNPTGNTWIADTGVWGIDSNGQAYCVDALFGAADVIETFSRTTTGSLGEVEYVASGDVLNWSALSGTWECNGTQAKCTALPGGGDFAVAAVELGSTTQTVEAYCSPLQLAWWNGAAFRIVDKDNFLFITSNGLVGAFGAVVGGVMKDLTALSGGVWVRAEVGADDTVKFWNAANGVKDVDEYVITDAVLQDGGSGTKSGLWYSPSASHLNGYIDQWRAGTTLSEDVVQDMATGEGGGTVLSMATIDFSGEPDFDADDGAVQVEIGSLYDSWASQFQGSGLCYRVVDARNYYKLVSTLFGYWYLYRVDDGVATEIGEWWLAYGPGRQVGVKFEGDEHRIYSQGILMNATNPWGESVIVDDTHHGTKHGFVSPYFSSGEVQTRWRNFQFGQEIYTLDNPVRGDILFVDVPDAAGTVVQKELYAPFGEDATWPAAWSVTPDTYDGNYVPIKVLSDTSTPGYYNATPTLSDGEIAFETDTNKFKVGAESKLWDQLPYHAPAPSIINDATSSRTLVFTDSWAYIRFSNGTSCNITVPDNDTTALPVGTQIYLRSAAAGTYTVVEDTSVTVNPPQGGSLVLDGDATLIKVDTDEWDLIGATA